MDKFPHHYLQLSNSASQATQPILSPTELQYLNHHTALLSHHYNASFLSTFPAQLQKLDDTAGGISMVDAPDAESAVFVRVLRDSGSVQVQGEQGVGEVDLRRGDVWILRWRDVKGRVLNGDMEMI